MAQSAEREREANEIAARNAQLRDQARAALADCDSRYPKDNAKIIVARMKCLNEAFAIQLPIFPQDRDLVQSYMADRMVIAERIQAGKMTFAEGRAAIAEKWSQVVSASQQRRTAANAVAAQEEAAAAQQRAANLAAVGLIMQNNQAIIAQQQAQQQQALQYVVRPIPQTAPPVNCTTSYVGSQAYTHCQ